MDEWKYICIWRTFGGNHRLCWCRDPDEAADVYNRHRTVVIVPVELYKLLMGRYKSQDETIAHLLKEK